MLTSPMVWGSAYWGQISVGVLGIPLDAGIPLLSIPPMIADLALPPLLHASSGLCAAMRRVWDQKYRYLVEQDGEHIPMQSCTDCPSLFSSLTQLCWHPWSSGRCPHPWQGSRNWMVCKVPFNSNTTSYNYMIPDKNCSLLELEISFYLCRCFFTTSPMWLFTVFILLFSF